MGNSKILFIVSTFARCEGEMQNPWMMQTLARLRDRGYDIEILAPAYQGLRDQTIAGHRVYRYRYFFKAKETLTHDEGAPNKIRGSILYKLMFFPYVFFGMLKAFRLCRRNRYRIVHCHWPFPHGLMGLAAQWGSRGKKPRLILHFYGASLLLAEKYRLVKPLLSYCIRKADRIICISSFTAGRVKKIEEKEVKVISYGTPLEYKPLPLPDNPVKRILTVGRVIERKGIPILVRAMPLILQRVRAELIIVGSGDDRELEAIKKTITELGLEESVTLAGRLADEELVNQYAGCDVFCLPAIIDSWGDTEGLGVVLLEAMNYQRPVVASDVGGIPDIIQHEQTGLLVKEKDPEDLAEKLIKVLTDSKVAEGLAERGCQFARTEFDWEKIMGQWDVVYGGNQD